LTLRAYAKVIGSGAEMGEKFQAVARCFQKPKDEPVFPLQTLIDFPIWTI
jgi:hypothetical protein